MKPRFNATMITHHILFLTSFFAFDKTNSVSRCRCNVVHKPRTYENYSIGHLVELVHCWGTVNCTRIQSVMSNFNKMQHIQSRIYKEMNNAMQHEWLYITLYWFSV